MTIAGERTEQLNIIAGFCHITGFMSDFRPPQTSAGICVWHDILGERTEQHVVIGFGELAAVD